MRTTRARSTGDTFAPHDQSFLPVPARLGTAVAAAAVVALLDCSAAAHALPPRPLAPACTDYVFPSSFEVMQDNGILVAINDQGNRFDGGGASYTTPKGDVGGISTGSRNGRNIDITVNWNNGFNNHYTGHIDDDLVARGTTVNNLGTTNTWYSLDKYRCIEAPPPAATTTPTAAPPPPVDNTPAQQGTNATVTDDVDVYDVPGGGGRVTGQLKQGRSVQLLQRRADNWCHVAGPNVPGGDGWAWGDYIS